MLKLSLLLRVKKKDLTFENHFQLFGRFKTINPINPPVSIHYFSIVKRLMPFSINDSNKKQMYKYFRDRFPQMDFIPFIESPSLYFALFPCPLLL